MRDRRGLRSQSNVQQLVGDVRRGERQEQELTWNKKVEAEYGTTRAQHDHKQEHTSSSVVVMVSWHTLLNSSKICRVAYERKKHKCI